MSPGDSIGMLFFALTSELCPPWARANVRACSLDTIVRLGAGIELNRRARVGRQNLPCNFNT